MIGRRQYIKKICLLGEPAVGKTSLIGKYVRGIFGDEYLSTVGAKTTSKTLEIERRLRIQREPKPPAYQQPPTTNLWPYSQPAYPTAYPDLGAQPQGHIALQHYPQPPQEPQQRRGLTGWLSRIFRWRRKIAERQTAPNYPLSDIPRLLPLGEYAPPSLEAGGFQPTTIQAPHLTPPVPEFEEVSEKVKLTLLIWDIAGQLKLGNLSRGFFSGAEGALIVADCSRPETIEAMHSWVERFRGAVGEKPLIFIGNKSDLVQPENLQRVESSIQEVSGRYGAVYLITSAKEGAGVEESFKSLGEQMLSEKVK